MREVIDHQQPGVWEESIYSHWLAVLRELSGTTAAPEYPQAMRTRAWAMKTLNTQLASWTALRHDTILYAKPTYTPVLICSYPHGFVEPRPQFWNRLQQLAVKTRDLIRQLTYRGDALVTTRGYFPETIQVDLGKIQVDQMAFLNNFASTIATLKLIADKELRQESLSGSRSACSPIGSN